MYNCLGRALRLEASISKFVLQEMDGGLGNSTEEQDFERLIEDDEPLANLLKYTTTRARLENRKEGSSGSSRFGVENADWINYRQLYEVLGPIRDVCVRLEKDTDVTISDVALFVHRLLYNAQKPYEDGKKEVAQKFVERFREKLCSLLDDVEQMFLWVFSSALDGRRKELDSWLQVYYGRHQHAEHFPNVHEHWPTFQDLRNEVHIEIVKQIKYWIGVKVSARIAEATDPPAQSGVAMTSSDSPETGDWLDEPIIPKAKKGEKKLGAVEREVKDYFDFKWREMTKNPNEVGALKWWKLHEGKFPNVADLARRRLSAQASSACSERSFSKAGLILRKHRMSLTTESVEGLSLLGWHVAQQAKESSSAALRDSATPL